MEFLQGRTLTNAIGSLDIQNAYADALNNLGHVLEEIAEQVNGFQACGFVRHDLDGVEHINSNSSMEVFSLFSMASPNQTFTLRFLFY